MPHIDQTLACPDCATQFAADINLSGWTGEELFTEAVARSAGDRPALRLMQGAILGALLAAHDRGLATEHLAS